MQLICLLSASVLGFCSTSFCQIYCGNYYDGFFHSSEADVWIPLRASWSLFPTTPTNMQPKSCWLNESLWSHFIESPKKRSMAIVSRMLIDNSSWQQCSSWLSLFNLLFPPIIIASFPSRLVPVWSFSFSLSCHSVSLRFHFCLSFLPPALPVGPSFLFSLLIIPGLFNFLLWVSLLHTPQTL